MTPIDRIFSFVTRLFLISLISLLAGCASRVPLTRALIREYQLSDNDVTRLQLYVSDDLLLEQQITRVDKNIDSSYSLKKVEDKFIKRVRFNAGTPCVALEAAPDKLKVAFEPDEGLNFVVEKNNPLGEIFSYQPEKSTVQERKNQVPSTSPFYDWKPIGQQTYKDTAYNVLVNGRIPHVLVDMAGLRKVVVEARTVPGIRQGEPKDK